jgi:beta-phosphoglucomutase-like phosphatase (HAD superfamily)
VLFAAAALGVFAIFAAGMWLIILTDREATKRREEQEKRRRR